MKIKVFEFVAGDSAAQIEAEVNPWLEENPDIQVIAMSQCEYSLTILYRERD